MKITREMSVADLAAVVCQRLADHGIEAVLTGGSVVTIYSENEYRSNDLDFISTARQKHIASAMATLGFTRGKAGPDGGQALPYRVVARRALVAKRGIFCEVPRLPCGPGAC